MSYKPPRNQSLAETHETVLVRGRARGSHLPQGRAHLLRELIETAVVVAVVFFVVRAVAQPYRISGVSMEPGLHAGDLVLVSPVAYAFGGSPQRGDVVVLASPASASGPLLIKRIIGLPGDIVSITPNSVTVDGKPLREPYLNGQSTASLFECGQFFSNIKVAPDQYLVLGDNRGNSVDSRCFGSVPRANIIGKATLMVYPLDQVHWIDTYSAVFAGLK